MAIQVGIGSYGLAAAAFGVLLLLVLVGARGSSRGRFLALACAGSLVWAAGHALAAWYQPPAGSAAGGLTATLELLRLAGWLSFLAFLGSGAAADVRSGRRRLPDSTAMVAVAGVLCVAVGAILSSHAAPPVARLPGHALVLGGPVAGLLLVEQFQRRAGRTHGWAVKHFTIGVGLMFAYDFYMYAEALLLSGANLATWQARGLVNALVVPLIAISGTRNPRWELPVGVSRKLVADSMVITGAGVYLLVMAGVGYYLRASGGAWGVVLQITLVFGAAALVMAALFSGTFRAWIRVFVAKNFFSYRYDYRNEWMRFIRTLSREDEGEPVRQRVIRAMAQIMDSPSGVLWSRLESGHYAVSATWNRSLPGTATECAEGSLPRFLESTEWIVDLEELVSAPERYRNLSLPRWIARFPDAWLICPLVQGQRLEAFVLLMKPLVHRRLDWEDRDLLKTAGRQAASYIALVHATEALVDSQQFDAFNRLSAYVVHDLKNVQSQLALISANASRYRDDPEFVSDALVTVERAHERLSRVLDHLRRREAVQPRGGSDSVDLLEQVSVLTRSCAGADPVPTLVGPDEPLRVRVDGSRLAVILEHLVRNAQEATPADGEIRVRLRRDGDWAVIEVRDNGKGMDEAFLRQRLFRPFQTTKDNAGMGVGVYEARQFVESSGGILDVWTRPASGTLVELRFPLVSGIGTDTQEVMEAVPGTHG